MAAPVNFRNKDFVAGLLFIGFSLGFAILGRRLEFGEPTNMGPGFFPLIVAALLAVLGLITMAGSLRGNAGRLPSVAWRPLAIIVGAPVIFALLVELFGLAPALGVSVFSSTLAGRPRPFWISLGLSSAIVFFCWLVFIVAFGVPIPFAKWPG
jgi:putative tricarboxylic transport membrane protein